MKYQRQNIEKQLFINIYKNTDLEKIKDTYLIS